MPALFASLVLLMSAAKIKEKKPIKTGASSWHITNLRQSFLETFDIYECNTLIELLLLYVAPPREPR
jgi:hypothetical protein